MEFIYILESDLHGYPLGHSLEIDNVAYALIIAVHILDKTDKPFRLMIGDLFRFTAAKILVN